MTRDFALDVLLALPRQLHRLVIRMLPSHYCARLARMTMRLEEINETMREFVRLSDEALPRADE